MKNPKNTLALAVIAVATCSACLAADTTTNAAPSLRWKYGYRDSGKANTIGSALKGEALPMGVSYVSTGYSPSQIATAYGFDKTTNNGVGSTINIVTAYGAPNLQKDLNVFSMTYGLSQVNVSVYYPNGTPKSTNSAWAAETTMDVEWAHAVAQGANINVIVAVDSSLTALSSAISYANSTLKANIVSLSWGAPEFSGERTLEALFTNPAITYFASGGDDGGKTFWPSVSRGVIGVGGTTMLYDSSSRTITNETAWPNGGGGVSSYITIPSYQVGINANSGKGTPDVAAVADPYTGVSVYFTDPAYAQGGWYVMGGTSLGAPLWAGVAAKRQSQGLSNVGLISNFYQYSKNTNSTFFRDITTGNNGFPALKGYDLTTGLGSPIVGALTGPAK